MANEGNQGIVAGVQDLPEERTEPSQHIDGEGLHDWELIHCSSEGWDEPSLFRCSKCGALKVSGTYGEPKAEGCPGGLEPQGAGSDRDDGTSGVQGSAISAEAGQLPASLKGKSPEERLAEWDAQSVLDILDRLEHGRLLTREDADARVQAALADVLPQDAEGHLLKPGDRARVTRDDGTTGEFTVIAVGRSTVITDTGESYAAKRCLHTD